MKNAPSVIKNNTVITFSVFSLLAIIAFSLSVGDTQKNLAAITRSNDGSGAFVKPRLNCVDNKPLVYLEKQNVDNSVVFRYEKDGEYYDILSNGNILEDGSYKIVSENELQVSASSILDFVFRESEICRVAPIIDPVINIVPTATNTPTTTPTQVPPPVIISNNVKVNVVKDEGVESSLQEQVINKGGSINFYVRTRAGYHVRVDGVPLNNLVGTDKYFTINNIENDLSVYLKAEKDEDFVAERNTEYSKKTNIDFLYALGIIKVSAVYNANIAVFYKKDNSGLYKVLKSVGEYPGLVYTNGHFQTREKITAPGKYEFGVAQYLYEDTSKQWKWFVSNIKEFVIAESVAPVIKDIVQAPVADANATNTATITEPKVVTEIIKPIEPITVPNFSYALSVYVKGIKVNNYNIVLDNKEKSFLNLGFKTDENISDVIYKVGTKIYRPQKNASGEWLLSDNIIFAKDFVNGNYQIIISYLNSAGMRRTYSEVVKFTVFIQSEIAQPKPLENIVIAKPVMQVEKPAAPVSIESCTTNCPVPKTESERKDITDFAQTKIVENSNANDPLPIEVSREEIDQVKLLDLNDKAKSFIIENVDGGDTSASSVNKTQLSSINRPTLFSVFTKESVEKILSDKKIKEFSLPEEALTVDGLQYYCSTSEHKTVCANLVGLLDKSLTKVVSENNLIENSEKQLNSIITKRTGVRATVDSDRDGITDYDEINIHNTDPNKADTDGDGRSDSEALMNQIVMPGEVAGASTVNGKIALGGDVLIENPKLAGVTRSKLLEVKNIVPTEIKKDIEGTVKGDVVKAAISGIALPNSFLKLFLFSDPIVVTVKTDDSGNWSYTLDKTIPDGSHIAYVAMVDKGGRILAKSSPLPFVKEASAISINETLPPSIDVKKSGFFNGMNPLFIVFGLILTLMLCMSVIGLVVSRKRNSIQHVGVDDINKVV